MGFRANLRERIRPFLRVVPCRDWYIGLFAELTGKVYRSTEVIFWRHNQSAYEGSKTQSALLFKAVMRIRMLKVLALPSKCRRSGDGW